MHAPTPRRRPRTLALELVDSLGDRIRVGGTVEMAGIDAPPDYRRSKVTVKRAKEALPNLRCEDFTEWMGHRPALPDTVPVIGPSARHRGLFYATGHGHLVDWGIHLIDAIRMMTGAAMPRSVQAAGGLFAYDATAPLDIQEEKRWHEDGVTITDFNYASPRGGRVPATLFVPDGPGPFAGMDIEFEALFQDREGQRCRVETTVTPAQPERTHIGIVCKKD